jgi:hypothetical protein
VSSGRMRQTGSSAPLTEAGALPVIQKWLRHQHDGRFSLRRCHEADQESRTARCIGPAT